MSRRTLVLGATGLLGPYLVEAAGRSGEAVAAGRSGGDVRCDLGDADAVAALLAEVRPDAVIHAAGLTDVDACERAPEAARRANADTAANVAAALPPSARLVYVSTDQVYPDTPGPHAEGGEGPVNTYGRSKLAGEAAALAHPRGVALRTNLFGPSRTEGRRSLSDWVRDSLAAGTSITLFEDSLFSPLHMATLAALTVRIADSDLTGAWNLGCRDGASKKDFGLAVARRYDLPTDTAATGRAADVPGRAPRARDLRLDVSRIEAALDLTLPTLDDEIAKL